MSTAICTTEVSVSVKVIVHDPHGGVLLLRRAKESKGNPGKWEFPGGKVDPGEAVDAALLREVKEETGLDIALEGSFGTCESKLQGRKIVYLVLEAEALSSDVRLSDEHDEFRWVAPADFDDVAFSPQFRRIARRYAQDVRIHPRVPPLEAEDGEAGTTDLFKGSVVNPDSLKEHLEDFQAAGEELEDLKDWLKRYLKAEINARFPMAQVEAQHKGPVSFAGKLITKNKYTDPLRQVTDLVGARVILHLQSEVDAVCRLIEEKFEIDRANSVDKLKELGPDRFGYRSVHYVVELREDRPKNADLPASAKGRKVEIQVRTIAQHAWSDIGHDRIYKAGCEIPEYWKREANRIAALLEAADGGFARLVSGLDAYRDHTAQCPDRDEAMRQLALWDAVRETIPDDASAALRVARLALEIEDWGQVVEVVDKFPHEPPAELLSAKGYALCKQALDPNDEDWELGIETLTRAAELSPQSLEPRLRLGELLTPHNRQKALDHYREAFELDSANPAALAGYIRCKVLEEETIAFIPLLRPDIEAAIGRCYDLVGARADIPHALYRIAGFLLLLGPERGSDGLAVLARAVHQTAYEDVLVRGLRDFDQLARLMRTRADIECARRFLAAALRAKFPEAKWPEDVPQPAAEPLKTIGPVAIVAGGCSAHYEKEIESYRDLLAKAFKDFKGTIISGGTIQGISGLVGQLAQESNGRIRAVGYLPRSLPPDGTAKADERYDELRETEGEGKFTAYEPIQNWLDLLAAGIEPRQVRLLGINGGNVAGLEYRLAVALGAQVGVIEGSGREAEHVAKDWPADPPGGLLVLPPDPMTVRAFLVMGTGRPSEIAAGKVEEAARLTHEEFLEQKRYQHLDPVMQPWPDLRDDLKTSNRSQIEYLVSILRAAGFGVRPFDGIPNDPKFEDEEVKLMGEMEHGRWNVERLHSGWKYATKKDAGKKLSPHIVSWKKLKLHIQKYDLQNVRLWPEILAEVGYEIYRLSEASGSAESRGASARAFRRGA